MRFKFRVESISSRYSIDGSKEIRTISLAPHLGNLKIGSIIELIIDNPNTWDYFELGKSYFIDIEKI